MGVPRTEIYRGKTDSLSFSRPISRCEDVWRKEETLANVQLDTLLLEQLTLAATRGETEVRVVDIGSGEAALFSDFLLNLYGARQGFPYGEIQAPGSTQFLIQNPGMHLRMTGLTDARLPLQHRTKHRVGDAWAQSSQVTAENVHFSLTKEQTYADFLKSQKIDQVHLTLATYSLPYFHPHLLRDTVTMAVESLAPGGKFIAAPYQWDRLRIGKYSHLEPPDNKSPRPLKQMVDALRKLEKYPTAKLVDEQVEKYLRLAQSLEPLTGIEVAPQAEFLRDSIDPLRKVFYIQSEILSLEEVLLQLKISRITDKRSTIIQSLSEQFEGEVTFIAGDRGFSAIKHRYPCSATTQ